jgi:hypothetical protein
VSISNTLGGGGVKCHFLNIGVKNANGVDSSRESKVYFPLFFFSVT